nr:ABC transporter ATP-binding protein/permease [Lacticaseibacillus yichunensis]
MRNSFRIICKIPIFWVIVLSITGTQFCNAFLAILTQRLLDAALRRNGQAIGLLCGIYALSFIAIVLFDFLSQYYSRGLRTRLLVSMQARLSHRLLTMSITAFQKHQTTRYQNAYTTEIESIVDDMLMPVVGIIQGVTGFGFSLAALSYLDPVLMGVVLAASVLPLVIPLLFRKSISQRKQTMTSSKEANWRAFSNILNGHRIIKIFKSEPQFQTHMATANSRFYDAFKRYVIVTVTANVLGGFFFYISSLAVLGIGGLRALQGIISPGTIAGVLQLNDQVTYPIQIIADNIKDIMGTKTVYEDFESLMLGATESHEKLPITGRDDALRLQDLSFQRGDERIIDDLTLTLFPGDRYLLTGASGAGKSTLLNLIKGNLVPSGRTVTCQRRLNKRTLCYLMRHALYLRPARATIFPFFTKRGMCR